MSENLTIAIMILSCVCAFCWAVWVIAVNIRRSRSGKQLAELWMAYVECFDHREIAGILRIGTASIRSMLARARTRFGDILRRSGLGQ
jgi:hypothetical protein